MDESAPWMLWKDLSSHYNAFIVLVDLVEHNTYSSNSRTTIVPPSEHSAHTALDYTSLHSLLSDKLLLSVDFMLFGF
jgi:hypothetical protein